MVLLDAKTKGRDAMKQPEGLHHKPLVIKQEVTLTGDIQGNGPAWLLLWVQGSTVSCHLERGSEGHKTKEGWNVREKSLGHD